MNVLSDPDGPVTHAWCEVCKSIQSAKAEPLTDKDTTQTYAGGDLVCGRCAFVIATLYRKG